VKKVESSLEARREPQRPCNNIGPIGGRTHLPTHPQKKHFGAGYPSSKLASSRYP